MELSFTAPGRKILAASLFVLATLAAAAPPAPPTTTSRRPAATRTPARWPRPSRRCRRGPTSRSPGTRSGSAAGPTRSPRPPPAAPASTSRRAARRTRPIKYWAYPGERAGLRLHEPGDLDDRLHARVRRHRQLAALQGARDRRRADEHVLQQRRRGERRRQRHLRAARTCTTTAATGSSSATGTRRPPDPQLRRARQLRRERRSRATARTPTASASTIRRRARRTIIRGCRAWWNSDDGYDLINQEVPVTVENSLGDDERLRQCTAPSTRRRATATASRWAAARPASGTSGAEQRGLEEQGRRAFTPTIRRAATPGTTTRRS